MGKVRSNKARVHLKAVSAPDCLTDHTIVKDKARTSQKTPFIQPIQPVRLQDNPFSGVKINFDSLKKQVLTLPETVLDDVQPKSESKVVQLAEPLSALAVRKKDKRKQRRETFLKKLEVAHNRFVETKKAIKRAKTPVVGDMMLLKMALPDISPTNCNNSKKVEKMKSAKGSASASISKKNSHDLENKQNKTKLRPGSKKRHKQGLEDIKKFKLALKNKMGNSDYKQLILDNIRRNSL